MIFIIACYNIPPSYKAKKSSGFWSNLQGFGGRSSGFSKIHVVTSALQKFVLISEAMAVMYAHIGQCSQILFQKLELVTCFHIILHTCSLTSSFGGGTCRRPRVSHQKRGAHTSYIVHIDKSPPRDSVRGGYCQWWAPQPPFRRGVGALGGGVYIYVLDAGHVFNFWHIFQDGTVQPGVQSCYQGLSY